MGVASRGGPGGSRARGGDHTTPKTLRNAIMQAEEVERNTITYSCGINGFFVVHTGYMNRMAFTEDASLEFLFYQPPTRGVLTYGVNDG